MKRLLSVLILISLLCCPAALADQLTEPLNEAVPFGVAHSADRSALTVYSAANDRAGADQLTDYQLCAILATKKTGSTLWYQIRYIKGKSFKEGYVKGDALYPLTLAGLIAVTADSAVAETLRALISESNASPFVLTQPSPTATPKPKATAKPTAAPKSKATAAPSSGRKKYVLNTKTLKFHLPSCSEADRITDDNRKNTTTTREALLDQGYTPCQKCNP